MLQDTIELKFRHPHSGKNCQIKRTQLPIAPAFAMTAHKSQGQTMTKIIVDLHSCRGTEAPYVMVSRVTSLEGLLILRPFNYAKISCHQSQDTRTEFRRLENIRLKTIAEIGSPLEKETALRILSPHTCPMPSTNRDAGAEVSLHSTLQTKRQKKIITGPRVCNYDPCRILPPAAPSATTDTDPAPISRHKKRRIDMQINTQTKHLYEKSANV